MATDLLSPSHIILNKYITRFQVTDRLYCPIGVEIVRYLIGEVSSSNLLTIDFDASEAAFSFFNYTAPRFRAIREHMQHAQRNVERFDLRSIELVSKMEWMTHFKLPDHIEKHIDSISTLLDTISAELFAKMTLWDRSYLHGWLRRLHVFWNNIRNEIRNHCFFRQFRVRDVDPFQLSVHWTVFFHAFHNFHDNANTTRIKSQVLHNEDFLHIIRQLINDVEHWLDGIRPAPCPDVVPQINVSSEIVLKETDEEVIALLNMIDSSNYYQGWWYNMFVAAYRGWKHVFEAGDSGHDERPKLMQGSRILFELEELIACLIPVLGDDSDAKYKWAAFRHKFRQYTFHFVLSDHWL